MNRGSAGKRNRIICQLLRVALLPPGDYRRIPTVFIASLLLLLPLSSSCFAVEKGLAKQVVAEINLARENPRGYAEHLRQFRRQFRGRSYLLPGTQTMVQTGEGVKAVDEAIRFLSRQKPLPPLAWSSGLAEAAAELADEEGESGAVGHQGRSSGGPRERIERHGQWHGRIGENIFYGPGDARQVAMNLIIDDGVPDRGHRKNIYSSAFALAGASCAPHPSFGTVCVIDFAGEFRE
jgi:uncharacterized protein YkwD